MENNLVIQDNQFAPRNINTITEEINFLTFQGQSTAIAYIIELGRRLKEAKSMLSHGEWGAWLKEKVNYSQSTANNYMKIFEEYGTSQSALIGGLANSQAFANLSYSKAVALLAVDKDERESFIQENDIENKSTREINALIKERDKERQRAEKAEKESEEYRGYKKQAEDAEIKKNEAESNLLKVKLEKKALEDKLKTVENTLLIKETQIKNLENNPVLSDEALKKIKEEARATLEDELKELEQRESDALSAKLEAEKQARDAEAKIIELERRLKMANSDISEFKVVFDRFQDDGDKLLEIISNMEKKDFETAKKLLFATKEVAKTIFAAKLGE